MSESEPQAGVRATDDAALRGAVMVGIIPNQPARVLQVAAEYAALMSAPLLVVNVDVSRYVTYEDPDGYVHSAPIDLNIVPDESDMGEVNATAKAALDPLGAAYTVRQLVGDPALAIRRFADRIDARLIVVGTRNRGIGDSIRQFFTGSVASRLANRQQRPVLVVPLGEPLADDADDIVE